VGEKEFRIEQDFRTVSQRLVTQFEQARLRASGHSGETGGAAEAVAIEFLRGVLPTKYSIGRGFVWDPFGHRSRQMDIVINDDSVLRGYPYDAERSLYLANSVAAVISVKSVLDSGGLRSGLRNVASAKLLRRKSIPGDVRVMAEWEKGERADIIPGFVLALGSRRTLATLKRAWESFYAQEHPPQTDHADGAAIVGVGMILDIPEDATTLGIKVGDSIRRGVVAVQFGQDTLLNFVAHLLFRLPHTVFAHPALWEYLVPSGYPIC
jgi:hypothetical protein